MTPLSVNIMDGCGCINKMLLECLLEETEVTMLAVHFIRGSIPRLIHQQQGRELFSNKGDGENM